MTQDDTAKRHLARFAARAAIFLIPVIVVLGASEVLLWRSGEIVAVGTVISRLDSNPDALFNRAFIDQAHSQLKFESVLLKKPAILVVGSSRVMQFRKEMFDTRADAFYNGGGLANSIAELEELTEVLPDSALPDVIILGVDFWWLSQEYDDIRNLQQRLGTEDANDWRAHRLASLRLLHDLVRHPGDAVSLWNGGSDGRNGAIGVGAAIKNEGFRPDGSWFAGSNAPDGWSKSHGDEALDRIARNCCRFQAPADGLAIDRLERLGSVLDWAARNDVAVIGYAPPVTQAAYDAMSEINSWDSFWTQFRELVPAVFAERGMPFIDATTPAMVGLDDRYILNDGFHGSETLHARVVQSLLADSAAAALLPGVSGAWTAEMLERPETTPWFLAE